LCRTADFSETGEQCRGGLALLWLDLNRRAGSLTGEANCLLGLAEIARMQGDNATARGLYEEARDLYRRAGALTGEASCLFGLAEIARMQGDNATARGLYEEARDLYRRAGNSAGVARCYQRLALLG
jgi:tetratricopeptide (TPR) repeat protein